MSFNFGGVKLNSFNWSKDFSDHGVQNIACAYMENGLTSTQKSLTKLANKSFSEMGPNDHTPS